MTDLVNIDVRNLFIYNYNIFFLDNHIPGPNAYKNQSLIGCHIFDSRFKSPCFISLARKFNFRDRNAGNPGPGSYLRFSEFGILAPKKDKEKQDNKNEDNKIENSNEELDKQNDQENINKHNNNYETSKGNNEGNENNDEDYNNNDNQVNEVLETV